jgi:hypothetical protein
MRLPMAPPELRALVLSALADHEVRDALRRALNTGLPPTHVTVKAFAARWSVSPRLVANWQRGGLPVVRLGRSVRIPVAQADAWVADLARRNPRRDSTS